MQVPKHLPAPAPAPERKLNPRVAGARPVNHNPKVTRGRRRSVAPAPWKRLHFFDFSWQRKNPEIIGVSFKQP